MPGASPPRGIRGHRVSRRPRGRPVVRPGHAGDVPGVSCGAAGRRPSRARLRRAGSRDERGRVLKATGERWVVGGRGGAATGRGRQRPFESIRANGGRGVGGRGLREPQGERGERTRKGRGRGGNGSVGEVSCDDGY